MIYRIQFLTYTEYHTSIILRHTLLEKRFLPGYWSIKLIIHFLFVLAISLYRQEMWICLGGICTVREGMLYMVKQVWKICWSFIYFIWFQTVVHHDHISFPAKPSSHQCSPGSLQIFVNTAPHSSWGMNSPTLSPVAIKWYKFIYSRASLVTEIKLNVL